MPAAAAPISFALAMISAPAFAGINLLSHITYLRTDRKVTGISH
jgi:hypothetical protein